MSLFTEIAESVVNGEDTLTRELMEKALAEGLPSAELLENGLVAGMSVVGQRFKNNEIFIPEVLVSARAMKAGMEILRPHLVQDDLQSRGKVVMGTIQGDLHDIGKNIVAMLLEGAGFEVIDLGADVKIERFVEAAKTEEADLVGMSALLTTTMINMKTVIEDLKKAGLSKPVKTMIGGAPVTRDYADRIGADGYASDASQAVDLALQLLKN
ncbi:MAG: corrinoid protein [Acidobacteria bacterium]|nr:corrinoid protein [Acidobacteriota bacterium]MBU4254783.1 corrinoid protein [Acidobacteriota bacterium]MBU4495952.1 corrinoid protein [Acidobacteriota bacterium]